MRRAWQGRRDGSAWGIAFAALALVLAAASLYRQLVLPGTLAASPWLIPDDARQFLAWTARIADPGAMRGDLIAGYWQAVSPPPYRWLFEGAGALGLPTLTVAHALPPLLLLLGAWPLWRLARALTADPMAAFLAAGAVLPVIAMGDALVSATPRGFAPPLLLLFLWGLAERRAAPMALALLPLAGVYPAPAVAAFGMLGLSLLRPWPRLFDWPRLPTLLLCAVAVVIGIAPFLLSARGYGPAIGWPGALSLPAMALPDGRSSIVGPDGRVAWLCSDRIGFAPTFLDCAGPADPAAWLLYALVLGPALLLLWLWRRERRTGTPSPWRPTPLYALALGAALVCYAIAAALAFELHLPSRYSQRLLEITAPLALAHLVGLALVRLAGSGRRTLAVLLAPVLPLAALVGAVLGMPRPVAPADPGLPRAVAALPDDALLAGPSDALAAVPALAGRRVLATAEHAIPYQLGYYRPVARRLADTLDEVSTDDPAALARFVRRYGVTHLVVDRAFLAAGALPPALARTLPAETALAARRLAHARSLVQRRADACAIYAGPAALLLDAACLTAPGRAGRSPISASRTRRPDWVPSSPDRAPRRASARARS
ncbi:hypothetical protein [Novosphingopyxis sp.]|uniref:hypothetical protein n=1 Tax=Novosphingopyxis sp. TaxID=2709690 RepID=UPI003B5980A4